MPLKFSLSIYLCLVCLIVFVNCLMKPFEIYLGVVAILLLNVIEVFNNNNAFILRQYPVTLVHVV